MALPILCFSQMPANLLNTKSSKDIENVSKIIEESDTPLQYEYVSDDDIIFSFTTWEVIDLN
ncbi:MAG: gliding motility protein GldN, partial [Bacteroidota bacterium]|nr:gliding motility protein GldN [Bacteroidota bacterium]